MDHPIVAVAALVSIAINQKPGKNTKKTKKKTITQESSVIMLENRAILNIYE